MRAVFDSRVGIIRYQILLPTELARGAIRICALQGPDGVKQRSDGRLDRVGTNVSLWFEAVGPRSSGDAWPVHAAGGE